MLTRALIHLACALVLSASTLPCRADPGYAANGFPSELINIPACGTGELFDAMPFCAVTPYFGASRQP